MFWYVLYIGIVWTSRTFVPAPVSGSHKTDTLDNLSSPSGFPHFVPVISRRVMNGVPKLWFLCQSFTTQCGSSDHHLRSSSQKSSYCWCMIILNHTIGVMSQRSHLKLLPFQDCWTLLKKLNRVVKTYINKGMKTATDSLSGPSVTFQRPSLSHPLECTMILPLVFIVALLPSWFRISA